MEVLDTKAQLTSNTPLSWKLGVGRSTVATGNSENLRRNMDDKIPRCIPNFYFLA